MELDDSDDSDIEIIELDSQSAESSKPLHKQPPSVSAQLSALRRAWVSAQPSATKPSTPEVSTPKPSASKRTSVPARLSGPTRVLRARSQIQIRPYALAARYQQRLRSISRQEDDEEEEDGADEEDGDDVVV
jgi:hypothetical protein